MASLPDQSRPRDKGKARATNHNQEPTETSPLLASQSYIIHPDNGNLESASQSNRTSLLSTLTTVFFITLSISILLALLLLSLAYSYAAKASHLSDNDILNNGLVFRGPDAIDVLNVSHHGDVWLRLDGRVGFDAGAVIGVNPDISDNFWLNNWKAIGRWSIRNLDTVSLTLSSINITSQHDPSIQLASIEIPPFQIPLTADPPDDASWLTPMSLPIHINPSHNVSAWIKFARESWQSGYAVAQVTVARADIQGGALRRSSWRSVLRVDRSNVTLGLHMKIPVMRSLPAPGDGRSLPSISDLVHLSRFSVSSSPDHLAIDATATITNPAPSFMTFTSPPLPFVVWIDPPNDTTTQSLAPLASVTAGPFALTHPNITIPLHGNVLPISQSTAPTLSSFISDYLSGIDHPISITSPFELFSDYTAHTMFPAPHPRPEVLRNVTIEGMKISASGTTILASGVVHARIALPEGMDVTLLIDRILPDVLIFDGPLPLASSTVSPLLTTRTTISSKTTTKNDDNDDEDVPPAPPLPSPLPRRAFARVRPDTWLSALSSPTAPRRDWNEWGNTTLRVSAWFADVPLEVLPGREREFRSFVSKVIFGPSEGAVAGLQGIAAVCVQVDGLSIGRPEEGDGEAGSGDMVLMGLPLQGSVRIGRK